MKRTQENFLEWAKDGMAVTFEVLNGTTMTGTVARNMHGNWRVHLHRFVWTIDCVKNLQPCKVAKQSHHRKPSPESEIVGSCTLLKKWKWMTIDYDGHGFYVWCHKPTWNGSEWCGIGEVEILSSLLFQAISTKDYQSYSQCIYRRQGDKWVHVG